MGYWEQCLLAGVAATLATFPHPNPFFFSLAGLFVVALVSNATPFFGASYALIAITERSLDASGNHRSFVLKGAQVNRFTLKRSDDFDVSDCAVFPPADLLVLERRYSLLRGVAIRIRRIHLDEIKEGAVVDGPQLFFADLGYQIDNMEGIGLHKNAQGETILTLVSDDNFSPIQRTLLLQFALVGE